MRKKSDATVLTTHREMLQGYMPEVYKYNAVTTAQHERRNQCVQDVQSAQEATARETVDIEI